MLCLHRAREVRILDMQRKLIKMEDSWLAAEERALDMQRSMAEMQERIAFLEKQAQLTG